MFYGFNAIFNLNPECAYFIWPESYVSIIFIYTFSIAIFKEPCSSNPCQNGGKCTIEGQTYKCECKPPYTGNECEIGK